MLKRDREGYERAHEVMGLVDGWYVCSLCHLVWQRRPKTFCAGVPVYRYGCWPADLCTYTQLRQRKLRPLDREQPDGAYFLRKSPYRRWLYRLDQAVPRRVPSQLQVEAIAKMRAGLAMCYTCQGCKYYDSSHGKGREAKHIHSGWCDTCWDAFHHLERQTLQCKWR